jgi:hypothetical protein
LPTTFSALASSFPSTCLSVLSLKDRKHSNNGTTELIDLSTDFRQFEQYLNVTGLDVSDIVYPQRGSGAHDIIT